MDNCPASDFFKCQVGCGICVKDNTVVAGGITVAGKWITNLFYKVLQRTSMSSSSLTAGAATTARGCELSVHTLAVCTSARLVLTLAFVAISACSGALVMRPMTPRPRRSLWHTA